MAQNRTITGTVTGENSERLDRASVTVVSNDSGDILAYTISDDQGYFELVLPVLNGESQIFLEVNYLGFKTQQIELIDAKDVYRFVLEPDATALDEIVIKNRPVVKRSGDTLKYRVSSFQKAEDRSIGDVLKRMPGVQVGDDGAIYFNGEKVSNLYIQGDDLMDGRYGLATKAIRKEDIQGVDVIKNHQPIKVLQDKVLTEKVAMNLVLKDENSMALSAKADIAGGLPGLYDLSITPILLNKRIKMLNTLAVNNAAVDYRADFKQLGDADLRSDISQDPASFSLSLGTVGAPDLPLSTYYFNKSKVVNLNNLYTTDSGLQLKLNVQAFTDTNVLSYNSRVANFTATDTLSYSEDQRITQRPFLFNSTLNILKNQETSFFQNKLSFNIDQKNSDAGIVSNRQNFAQELQQKFWTLSNDFNWIPQLKNEGVFEVRWLSQYSTNDKKLSIGNGYNSEIPGFMGMNDEVNQSFRLPTFNSNAYVSYIKGSKVVKQQYQLGYLIESQRLESGLTFRNNDQVEEFQMDCGNNLQWLRQQAYFKPSYQFATTNFEASLNVPVIFQTLSYQDKAYELDKKKTDFFINPELSIKYKIAAEEELTARYAYGKTFGNITQVFRGAVLRNYRFLESNEADLQETRRQSYGLNYKFEKSVALLFLNAGLSYEKSQTNSILSYTIEDDIQTIVSLPLSNETKTYSANLSFSKYVFALRNVLSFKSGYNYSIFNRLINDELVPFTNNSFVFSTQFNKKFFKKLTFTYRPRLIFSTTKVNEGSSDNLNYQTFRVDQEGGLNIQPFQGFQLGIDLKHSYMDQGEQEALQYLFCDLNLKYALAKKDVDISLALNNIFNTKDYQLYAVNENQLLSSSYTLRGAMALLRVEWFFLE